MGLGRDRGGRGPRVLALSEGGRLELAASLQPFNACEDLLSYLRTEGAARVTAYGLPGVGGGYPFPTDGIGMGMPVPVAADSAAESTTKAGPVTTIAASGEAYSTTNTVEAGIDEELLRAAAEEAEPTA